MLEQFVRNQPVGRMTLDLVSWLALDPLQPIESMHPEPHEICQCVAGCGDVGLQPVVGERSRGPIHVAVRVGVSEHDAGASCEPDVVTSDAGVLDAVVETDLDRAVDSSVAVTLHVAGGMDGAALNGTALDGAADRQRRGCAGAVRGKASTPECGHSGGAGDRHWNV